VCAAGNKCCAVVRATHSQKRQLFNPRQIIMAAMATAAALGRAGRFTDAVALYEELLAAEPGSTALRGALLVGLGEVYWLHQARQRAYEFFQQAQPLVALDDLNTRALLHLRAGQALLDSPLTRPQALQQLMAALQLGGEDFIVAQGGPGGTAAALDAAKTVVPAPPTGWRRPLLGTVVRSVGDDLFLQATVRTPPAWHSVRVVRYWQIELPDEPGRPLRVAFERNGRRQSLWTEDDVTGAPMRVPQLAAEADAGCGLPSLMAFRARGHALVVRVDDRSTLLAAYGRFTIDLFCDGRSCDVRLHTRLRFAHTHLTHWGGSGVGGEAACSAVRRLCRWSRRCPRSSCM
jgi:tetratricopeptide (TPR) repeat protein